MERLLIFLFTFRIYDLITTLTYVLMDNICPCLIIDSGFEKFWGRFQMMPIAQDSGFPIKFK